MKSLLWYHLHVFQVVSWTHQIVTWIPGPLTCLVCPNSLGHHIGIGSRVLVHAVSSLCYIIFLSVNILLGLCNLVVLMNHYVSIQLPPFCSQYGNSNHRRSLNRSHCLRTCSTKHNIPCCLFVSLKVCQFPKKYRRSSYLVSFVNSLSL